MTRAHDETSAALLAAAHRLLSDSGGEALTVRRIATEAGVSTMNVYSRFGGKDGVIDELYMDGYRRLTEALEAVPITDEITTDLALVADAYREFAIGNPTYYGIMFRSAVTGFQPSPQAAELGLGGLDSFAKRLCRGQERGEVINPDNCDCTDIAAWLWATCHGFVSLELESIAAERVTWSKIYSNGIRCALGSLSPAAAHDRPG